MTFADLRSTACGTGRGGLLLPVLLLTAMLLLTPWQRAAWASGSSVAAAEHVANTEAAVGNAELPTFSLPPIVLQVREINNPKKRTIAFKAALVFDEVDEGRIEDSMSVTKSVLPRIMDSVIIGIQGERFNKLPDPEAVDRLVIQHANAVLKPYGVVIKALKMHYLDAF
jgi:hypothetical protein